MKKLGWALGGAVALFMVLVIIAALVGEDSTPPADQPVTATPQPTPTFTPEPTFTPTPRPYVEPTPRPSAGPLIVRTPTAAVTRRGGGLERAVRSDGDFSTRAWSANECSFLAKARQLGYEYGYVDATGEVRYTKTRSFAPGRPFTALDGEWLRHCV